MTLRTVWAPASLATVCLVATGCVATQEPSVTQATQSADPASPTSPAPQASPAAASTQAPTSPVVPVDASLTGPDCGSYAATSPRGPRAVKKLRRTPTFAVLAQDPWAGTMNKALTGGLNSRVDLSESLAEESLTFLLPTEATWTKGARKGLKQVAKDPDALFKLLARHLVLGSLDADSFEGTYPTLAGPEVVLTGGDNPAADGVAVLCGGLETANATIYFLDGILPSR